MEHIQQLAGVCFKKRYCPSNRQKTLIYDLRRETKSLALRLSSLQTLDDILEKLSLNYSIIKLGINIDLYESIEFDEIKHLFAQLKNIQKQSLKNKYSQKFDGKKLLQLTLKNIPKQIQKNKNKDNSTDFTIKNKKTFGQRSQENLMYEIKKELSARKYLKDLNRQHQDHIKKKNDILLIKVNHSAEKNKIKSEKHQKALQVEKQNFSQSFMNSPTFMTSSCFKNYEAKQPIIKHPKLRLAVHQSMNFNDESIIYEKTQQKYFQVDRIKTQQNYRNKYSSSDLVKYKDQTKNYRLKMSHNNIKQKSQSVASNSKSKQKTQKILQVQLKKSNLDQFYESLAVKKVIQKNLLISKIKQNKINLKNEKNTNKANTYQHLKMLTEVEKQKMSDELQLKIKNNLQQKNVRRCDILNKKLSQAKIRLIYSRQRFIQRRQEIEKQNYDKISEYQQALCQYRYERKAKKRSQNLKVERLIKKKREMGEQRQILSQQIMNIRKLSDEQLQRRLDELQRKTNSELIRASFL